MKNVVVAEVRHKDEIVELRRDYGKLKKGFTKQLTEAKNFGARLLKLKPQFPRTWLQTLKTIGISYSNASRLIRLAENWDKVKSEKDVDTMEKAIKMLQKRREDKLTNLVNCPASNIAESPVKQGENVPKQPRKATEASKPGSPQKQGDGKCTGSVQGKVPNKGKNAPKEETDKGQNTGDVDVARIKITSAIKALQKGIRDDDEIMLDVGFGMLEDCLKILLPAPTA